MTRRDLFKLVGLFSAAPFLPKVVIAGVPKRYRGFDVTIDTMWDKNKQIFVSKDHHYTCALFGPETPDIEIWQISKPEIDRAIDRHERRHNAT